MRLFSVLATSLLLAPALLAQRFPEIEPNNTVGTAQPVVLGTQVDASLALTEEDWYSFTLPAATRIRIHTSSIPSTLPNHGDTRISLFDASGTTILGLDDDARGAANGWTSDLTLNVAAGSYRVQVVPFDPTVTGPYSFEIAEIRPFVYNGTEIEPNDTHLTATPTGVLGGTKRFHGNLGANTIVFSGTVDAPAVAPQVDTGLSAPGLVVFSGTVVALPASTTTTTQTAPLSQPMANPPLTSYVPGMHIRMTSGLNNGLTRLISSNTATAITAAAFPVANAAGDTFDIITVNTTTVTWVPSLALASLYVGGSAYSLRMTSGANAGQSRPISANTGPSAFGSEITTTAFTAANAPGDTWAIDCTLNTTTVFRTLTPMVSGLYNPTTGGNALGRYQVRFTSGANVGLDRTISGNTVSSITMTAITAAPAAGDTFVVELVDVDYWQVVLPDPVTAVWFQINEGSAPAVFGHKYELYNSLGLGLLPITSIQTPAYGSPVQASIAATATSAHSSSARVWPAGTYYIAVRNPSAALNAPFNVLPTGNYLLELFTAPVGNAGNVAETEPVNGPNSNNTAATATPLTLGQTGLGNVTSSTGTDPSDWWGPFSVTSPRTITFQVRRGATATPMLDSTLNIRDAAGALVLTATTGNILDVPSTLTTGPHGRTTVSFFLSGQTYYVEVIAPGTTAASIGDYELQTSAAIPAPYVLGSYTRFAANEACGPTVVFTDTVAPSASVFSGIVASSTTTVITTSGLVASAYIGSIYSVQMTSGANIGLIRTITANTATTITTAAWPAAPVAADTYNIINTNSTTVTWVTGALPPGAYVPGFAVRMTSGANNGLIRAIAAHTANAITTVAWPVANVAADTYQILAVPTLATQFPSEIPALGSLFSRQVYGCPANAPFLLFQGFSTTLAYGTTPLPYSLPGGPDCTVNVDPLAATLLVANGAGVGEFSTQLPSALALRGFHFFEQAIVLNAAANALGAQMSNYARLNTGERTY